MRRAWSEEHGRAPRVRDWGRTAPGHPNYSTVLDRFGTWYAASGATRSSLTAWRRPIRTSRLASPRSPTPLRRRPAHVARRTRPALTGRRIARPTQGLPTSFSLGREDAVPRSSGGASTRPWRHSARLRPGATSLPSRTHTMSSPRRPQRSGTPSRKKTGLVRRDEPGARARRSLCRPPGRRASGALRASPPSPTGRRYHRSPSPP